MVRSNHYCPRTLGAGLALTKAAGLTANAQEKTSTQKAKRDHSSSDPAQQGFQFLRRLTPIEPRQMNERN